MSTDEKEVAAFEGLEFDLTLTEIPVKVFDPKTKKTANYILREMTGDIRDDYLDDLRSRTDHSGERPVVTSFKGLQAKLVHLSLFNQEDQNVPMDRISGWPSRVQTALFKKAQKISAIDEGADEEAKND